MQFYGTLGPACSSTHTMEKLFSLGMTGMRLNLSHRNLDDVQEELLCLHRVAPHAQLLIDLQGPELRLGNTTTVEVDVNESVMLGTELLPIPAELVLALRPGMEIMLGDGGPGLCVTALVEGGAICRALSSGAIAPRRSIHISKLVLNLPTLTKNDLYNLSQAKKYGVTGVMLPFVRNQGDLLCLRQALEAAGVPHVRVFAKIENMEGVSMLPQFLECADEIVIARGDLGREVELWQLPRVQKEIAAQCCRVKKPFMVVTQLLYSMIDHPGPTRAEVCDIFCAVLDGASSLMLTDETAIGQYPDAAMRMLCKTAQEAKKYLQENNFVNDRQN